MVFLLVIVFANPSLIEISYLAAAALTLTPQVDYHKANYSANFRINTHRLPAYVPDTDGIGLRAALLN